MQIPDKEAFSVREASRILGYSHRALTRGIKQGKIVSLDFAVYQIGAIKLWKRIPRSEIERLAREKGLI